MTHTTLKSFAWNARLSSSVVFSAGTTSPMPKRFNANNEVSSEAAPEAITETALIIESPVTAEVFVDNIPAGQTPLTLDVEVGKHTVRIAADGFDPFVRRVTVVDGQPTTLKADLIEGGGTVEFQASISLQPLFWMMER